MYQVTIKGRTIAELQHAIADIGQELGASTLVTGMEKSLDAKPADTVVFPQSAEAVPAATLTPTAAPTFDGEIDAEGIPWDARIHTTSKTKVKAGTWKVKRGTDANVVTQVKHELLAHIQQLTNPPVVPAAPITPQTPAVSPVLAATEAAPIVLAPAVHPAVDTTPVAVEPPAPVQPQVTTGHSLQTFKAQFAMTVASLIAEGKVDQGYINQLQEYFGVEQIWQITDEQKEQVFIEFTKHGFITSVG